MADEAEEPRRSTFIDLSPLRHSPAFARLWTGSSVAAIGGQMTIVAVALHLWELTQSTLAVSLVAAFALVPTIVAGLWGGMLADAADRRRVLLAFAIITWVTTAVLAGLTWFDAITPTWLYVLTVLTAVGSTVLHAARASSYPRLLPPHLLPAAAALGGITMGLAVTLGPALAGVLVAATGFGWTYTVDVVLFSAAFLGIWSMPSLPPQGPTSRPGLTSLTEGAQFLGRSPNVRMSFLVDIVAMVFGHPRVVFPAAGALLFGGGAITVGALTAAFAIGTVISSVFSGRVTAMRAQGKGTARAIMAYGACTAAFGGVLLAATLLRGGEGEEIAIDPLGWALLAAGLLALMGAGACDNVSAIFRQSILQTAAPDHMRGRLQGVFIIVVTGGPRIGDLYVGILATALALWSPLLLGGFVIVGLTLVLMRLHPSFAAYDARHPEP